MTVERIAAAAILVKGEVWTLPPPARHHVLIHAWSSAHFKNGARPSIPDDHEQGFVTSTGRFVDRYEARKIAEATGQLLPHAIRGRPQLFSEDVW